MSQVSITSFAKQVGTSVEKLLGQLADAGVKGKRKNDLLDDAEKRQLLQFLQGGGGHSETARQQITLKRRTTNEIKQTSRTGAARTVHVEVKKRRTYVKRSTIDTPPAEPTAKFDNEPATQAVQQKKTPAVEKKKLPQKTQPTKESITPSQSAAPPSEPPPQPSVAVPQPETPPEQEKIEPKETKTDTDHTESAAKAPSPADSTKTSPPPADTKETPRKSRKKNRKSKGGERAQGRAELHVAKGRGRKNRRKPLRKLVKISSSISDAHAFAKPTTPLVHEVKIPESISVNELAQAMSIKAGEVIKTMMAMGSMVTINQLLDQDTAIVVVEELGHVAKAMATEDPESLLLAQEDDTTDMRARAPVVAVMGHVDHGKTSLLDYIRKSKVTAGEAGGITQHIGAYKVKLAKGEICFLDTPGHEAFSAMRVRGAKVTDLVILVVAADDGVKPQTIEAISHARAAGAPIIVALNKIDREQAAPDKVKQELSVHGVVAESLGGDVLMNEVSALSGKGVDDLLESVLLQAEVLDLKARYSGPARGQIVEAWLDKGRGPAATVLVQQGILRRGDIVLAGRESGRVRMLTDAQRRPLEQAEPSTPVEIQGLDGVPVAGDDIFVMDDERKAREIALYRQSKYNEVRLAKQQKSKLEIGFNRIGEADTKPLNLLIKGDVQGSVESLSEAIEKLSNDEVRVKVVHGMVGGINESDVNLAATSSAIIIGFNVRADATARKLIEREGIAVHYHNVIYQAVDLVKGIMSGMLLPLISEQQVGLVEVRDVFKAPKIGAIAGSYVLNGSVRRNLPVRVLRDNIVIFEGEIDSLRRFKDDVGEVKNGLECGIGIKNYNDVKVGDQIEVFEVVKTAQQL